MNHHERIRAYFHGGLSEKEKTQFEEDLSTDPELKKAAIMHSLGFTSENEEEESVRNTMTRVRSQLGPLPGPEIKGKDSGRFFLYDRPRVLRAAAIAILLIGSSLLIAILLGTPTANQLAQGYFLAPDSGDTAGPQEQQSDLKEESSSIYWGIDQGGLEALQSLAGKADSFNIANFYLAHWYLKEGRYDAALDGFDQCIANKTVLDQYDSGYFEQARFNRILADLGRSGNSKILLSEIDAFLDEFPGNQKARDLREELNRPLRKVLGR